MSTCLLAKDGSLPGSYVAAAEKSHLDSVKVQGMHK